MQATFFKSEIKMKKNALFFQDSEVCSKFE